jgi:hypothetical protein
MQCLEVELRHCLHFDKNGQFVVTLSTENRAAAKPKGMFGLSFLLILVV